MEASSLQTYDVDFIEHCLFGGGLEVMVIGNGLIEDMSSVRAYLGYKEPEPEPAPVPEPIPAPEPVPEVNEIVEEEPVEEPSTIYAEDELLKMRNVDLRDILKDISPDLNSIGKTKKILVSLILEAQSE
jgi:hypothetical protein